MSNIFKALPDCILFEFVEERKDGMLLEKNQTIILTASANIESQRSPRWGKVKYVGPNVVDDIKVGEYILIEPLQWSMCCDVPNDLSEQYNIPNKLWKTDQSKVLATSEEEVNPEI